MKVESKKLRKIRDSRRLSQQEVADKIGISQSTYCEWEKNNTDIKLEALIKLSEVFDVELEELAPETTSIRILNNNNNTDQINPVVGFDITVDGFQIYQDLIASYKAQILQLEKRNIELEERVATLGK